MLCLSVTICSGSAFVIVLIVVILTKPDVLRIVDGFTLWNEKLQRCRSDAHLSKTQSVRRLDKPRFRYVHSRDRAELAARKNDPCTSENLPLPKNHSSHVIVHSGRSPVLLMQLDYD